MLCCIFLLIPKDKILRFKDIKNYGISVTLNIVELWMNYKFDMKYFLRKIVIC